jgi:hypothetical protein
VLARSGDWIAAGDGLGAFGAALILAVQVHLLARRITAGQWIYAKPGHARRDLQLRSSSTRFSSEYPTGRAVARGNLGPSPSSSTLAKAQPPHSREDSHACTSYTGPGAEGGGGWPMQATAQPWHAQGRPLLAGAPHQRSQPNRLNSVFSTPSGVGNSWRSLCGQPGAQALGSVRRTPSWPWRSCSRESRRDRGSDGCREADWAYVLAPC